MKKRTIVFFGGLLLVTITSCDKADRLGNDYSDGHFYPYTAFTTNENIDEWVLESNNQEISIDYRVSYFHDEKYKELQFLNVYWIQKGDSIIKINTEAVFNKGDYESFSIAQVKGNLVIAGGESENRFSTSTEFSSSTLQLSYVNSLEVNGTVYTDVAHYEFFVNSSNEHISDMYIAPNVGPIRVIYGSNEVFDLKSSNTTMIEGDDLID